MGASPKKSNRGRLETAGARRASGRSVNGTRARERALTSGRGAAARARIRWPPPEGWQGRTTSRGRGLGLGGSLDISWGGLRKGGGFEACGWEGVDGKTAGWAGLFYNCCRCAPRSPRPRVCVSEVTEVLLAKTAVIIFCSTFSNAKPLPFGLQHSPPRLEKTHDDVTTWKTNAINMYETRKHIRSRDVNAPYATSEFLISPVLHCGLLTNNLACHRSRIGLRWIYPMLQLWVELLDVVQGSCDLRFNAKCN